MQIKMSELSSRDGRSRLRCQRRTGITTIDSRLSRRNSRLCGHASRRSKLTHRRRHCLARLFDKRQQIAKHATRHWTWEAASLISTNRTGSVGRESDRLRHAAPDHDPDAGRGPDQRRRSGLQPDAGGHLPVAEHAEDLRLPRLHRHEPRPDGRVHRQPARAVFPVRRRHPGHQYAEHPAGGPVRAVVLPRHRHGPGDGPGGGHVGPGHVVDAQGHVAADDHAHGRRQRAGRLPGVRERGDLAGGDGRPCAEHHPAAGAEERARHGGDLAVRPEHAVDRHQRRPAKTARLQPDAAAGHRCAGEGEHDHPGGQHLHQGLDAGGREQRDGRRHPADWATSRSGWGRTSTSATWRPSRTTPTSPTAMRWSTARSRSICRSSRRTPARP